MEIKGVGAQGRGVIIFGVLSLALWVALRFLWTAMLPFVLAYIISLPVRGVAKKISGKTKIPFKTAAVCVLIISLILLACLFKWGLSLLCGEILALCRGLASNPELIIDLLRSASEKISTAGGIFSFFGRLVEIGELSGVAESLESAVSDGITSLVLSLGEKISGAAVNFASKLPSALLFCLAFFLSCFYFCCDDGKISDFFLSLLPDGARKSVPGVRKQIKKVISGYVIATFSLCGITLFIVLCGLLCIGCKYAILLSMVIAVIDMLPLLGSGIVLLPWALVCFLGGDVKVGIALLVIWIIATVVHQLAEPKLLGKHIGLHPLATLMSVYIGAELFGFIGLIAGPLIAVGIKAILPIIKEKSTE